MVIKLILLGGLRLPSVRKRAHNGNIIIQNSLFIDKCPIRQGIFSKQGVKNLIRGYWEGQHITHCHPYYYLSRIPKGQNKPWWHL